MPRAWQFKRQTITGKTIVVDVREKLFSAVIVHAPASNDGAGWREMWASTAFDSQAKVFRDWRRQVSTTVRSRSTNRLPVADRVPKESFRQMTA